MSCVEFAAEHNEMSYSLDRRLHSSFTVAILAQGTSWAVAVTQAFLLPGSILVGCTWEVVHGVAKPSAC